VKENVSFARGLQARDDLEQRRFSAARRADDREERARRDVQADRVERMGNVLAEAISFPDAVRLDEAVICQG
jgi:hypothetical protein